MKAEVVTEAIRRTDGEYYYGTLERRKNRVVFTYTDFRPDRVEPDDVRKVYPDVVAFSKDWRITAQLPLDER